MCIKSEGIAELFFKHATSNQIDKTFLLASKQIVPKGCLFLSWGFIYMYETYIHDLTTQSAARLTADPGVTSSSSSSATG